MFCSMHFSSTCLIANTMSMVLRPGRNPHSDSGRIVSEMLAIRRFRAMRAMILPPMDNKEMRITEFGFNFLNNIIIFFVDSRVQKSIFGLFSQCLYSYQNKGPRGARVQNHSTVTRGYLNNLQKAILLGLW